MRFPRALLLGLLVVLAAGNLWETIHRSGIPVPLEGAVEHIEVRREKHVGLDDVHLVTVAGRQLHLDGEVVERLRVGDVLSKSAWSHELVTPRDVSRLEVSTDARRMRWAMPLLLVLGLALAWRRRGPRQSQSPSSV